MIEYLSGLILSKKTSGVVLDVNGVGYGLSLPLSHFVLLGQIGEKLSLWIYTRVREDQLALYGFLTQADRDVFEILLNCNGVGPKVALAIMSTVTPSDLLVAIEQKNLELFESVPGVGKRTAEKILVELQSKVSKFPASLDSVSGIRASSPKALISGEKERGMPADLKSDLVSALMHLGFKEKDITPVLKTLNEDYSGEDFSFVTKKALSELSSGKSKKTKKQEASQPDFDTLF